AMLNIAQAYPKLEQWNKVLEWGQKAASCDPKSYLAYNQIAFAHNKMKRWDEAEAAARKALQIQDNPISRSQIDLAQKGRNAEATNLQAELDKAAYEAEIEKQRLEEEERQRRLKEWEIKTGEAGNGNEKAEKTD
ncbi:MAG: tetratricopeptide repeat protein, partial [Acidobacteriota bacterium]